MTRKTSIGKAFERYEVDVDGTVVEASIDVRDSNVNRTAARLMKRQARLDELRADLPDMDGRSADEAAHEVASILRESISDLIGEDKYLEVLAAVADGSEIEPEDANYAMCIVFADLFAYVAERLRALVDGKSARYLAHAGRKHAR